MRLLANENIPRQSVEALRQSGHDVLWARTDMASTDDRDILARAQGEGRIVLTHDKDFGDLAVHAALPASCGIILLRLAGLPLDAVVERTVAVIDSRTDWPGHFAVVDRRRVRMRPLPTGS